MKRLKLSELKCGEPHILSGLVSQGHIRGGFSFKKPGQRTHDKGCECPNCNGTGRHAHEDEEVFIFIEGRGVMEVDGVEHPVEAGDVVVVEPGEDHHLRADDRFPCANLWLHGSDEAAWEMPD